MYMHESNMRTKMTDKNSKYYKHKDKIEKFHKETYTKYREQLESIDFSSKKLNEFDKAAKLIDEYLKEVKNFEKEVGIDARSKFRSTFIEEISTYLFKDLPLIKDGTFGIFNKKIFAGMKINKQMHIDTISKDVDFCIGKKIDLKIDETTQKLDIIVPIICVEVKTYLDSTMFGEAQWSSRQIKNASPNVKTYILMEHNEVKKEKIIVARYDNNLNEMFVLRSGNRKANTPLNPEALLKYYKEISNTIEHSDVEDQINKTGNILNL